EDFGPSLTLVDCSFLDNQGGFGGAIDTEAGTLAVTTSTFVGNAGPGNGGAISLGCPATVTNCTFVANGSDGVRQGGATDNSGNPLFVTNSLFLNNLARSVNGGEGGATSRSRGASFRATRPCRPTTRADPAPPPAGARSSISRAQTSQQLAVS